MVVADINSGGVEGVAKQIAALGFAPGLVAKVADRVRAQAFKWREIPAAELPGRVLRLPGGED